MDLKLLVAFLAAVLGSGGVMAGPIDGSPSVEDSPFSPLGAQRTRTQEDYETEGRKIGGESQESSAFSFMSAESNPLSKYAKVTIAKDKNLKKYIDAIAKNDFQEVSENDIIVDQEKLDTYAHKNSHTVSFVFNNLFDIIRDLLNIMSQIENNESFDREDCKGKSCSWPMIRNVFLKYLRLVRETELLSELRDVIPIDKLEHALQTGDAGSLMQVMVKTATPAMFSLFAKALSDLLSTFMYFTSGIHTSKLREYIPSDIDVMWPIKFVVGRALRILGHLFSKQRLDYYWEEVRAFSPFTSRSLDSTISEEYETENELFPISTIRANDVGIIDTMIDNPYVVAAGVASTAIASVFAYNMMASSDTSNYATNREDQSSRIPFTDVTFADLTNVLASIHAPNFEI